MCVVWSVVCDRRRELSNRFASSTSFFRELGVFACCKMMCGGACVWCGVGEWRGVKGVYLQVTKPK